MFLLPYVSLHGLQSQEVTYAELGTLPRGHRIAAQQLNGGGSGYGGSGYAQLRPSLTPNDDNEPAVVYARINHHNRATSHHQQVVNNGTVRIFYFSLPLANVFVDPFIRCLKINGR
jgi:hypothetical protein